MRRHLKGISLIGTLVAVVIAIGAAAFFATGGMGLMEGPAERPDGKGKTLVGSSLYAAKDSNCKAQLRQLRMSVEIHAADQLPTTIEELNVGASFYLCPVGDEKYDYDPATGVVSCSHKGHEDY
ncbi:MAG: hypothetical protein IH945_03630 [Armatimonadetes bacterium]|nr:hypothetical protein [Armatimonadota bacterium]